MNFNAGLRIPKIINLFFVTNHARMIQMWLLYYNRIMFRIMDTWNLWEVQLINSSWQKYITMSPC